MVYPPLKQCIYAPFPLKIKVLFYIISIYVYFTRDRKMRKIGTLLYKQINTTFKEQKIMTENRIYCSSFPSISAKNHIVLSFPFLHTQQLYHICWCSMPVLEFELKLIDA